MFVDKFKYTMKNQKYHIFGTVPKSNQQVGERGKIPLTHINMITAGGVNLAVLAKCMGFDNHYT